MVDHEDCLAVNSTRTGPRAHNSETMINYDEIFRRNIEQIDANTSFFDVFVGCKTITWTYIFTEKERAIIVEEAGSGQYYQSSVLIKLAFNQYFLRSICKITLCMLNHDDLIKFGGQVNKECLPDLNKDILPKSAALVYCVVTVLLE